jgi:hypothetical protein
MMHDDACSDAMMHDGTGSDDSMRASVRLEHSRVVTVVAA